MWYSSLDPSENHMTNALALDAIVLCIPIDQVLSLADCQRVIVIATLLCFGAGAIK